MPTSRRSWLFAPLSTWTTHAVPFMSDSVATPSTMISPSVLNDSGSVGVIAGAIAIATCPAGISVGTCAFSPK